MNIFIYIYIYTYEYIYNIKLIFNQITNYINLILCNSYCCLNFGLTERHAMNQDILYNHGISEKKILLLNKPSAFIFSNLI